MPVANGYHIEIVEVKGICRNQHVCDQFFCFREKDIPSQSVCIKNSLPSSNMEIRNFVGWAIIRK